MDVLFMKSGMRNKDAIEVLKSYDGYFYGHSSDEVAEALDLAIKALSNGEWIPLPQNATNGDVIKAMFPNEHFIEMYAYVVCGYTSFDKDWWNAPFKRG